MAPQSRRSGASLIEAFRAEPERFDFVQAVRLLERLADGASRRASGKARVGVDNDPQDEAVLLRAALELVFPETEVDSFADTEDGPELAVNLMGLNGPSGVLPGFYSQLIQEAHRDKNGAMRDFFDLFNHRALSFFARAAEKYRLPLAYEGEGGDGSDAISGALYALVGLRLDAVRRRQAISDETLIFYGGLFANRTRSAGALARMVADYFGGPATVRQFQGRWVSLAANEQSRLGGLGAPGPYSQLGADAVVGSMVYDVQGAFRVGLGPLDYPQFLAFLPDGALMAELVDLTRTFVGPALSFDVQLTLKASEIPRMALTPQMQPRLGWNTWLPTTAPRGDASDAVFQTPET